MRKYKKEGVDIISMQLCEIRKMEKVDSLYIVKKTQFHYLTETKSLNK